MKCIADTNGKKFYHPLCPIVHLWRLESFDYNELKAFKSELPTEDPINFKEIGETQEADTPPKKTKRNKRQNPDKKIC